MKIRLIYLFMSCLVLWPQLFCTQSVAADTYPNRISLAISGGASKGAYEAGLIWGLVEVLRQVENSQDWSWGGDPRSIEIASIAGTSAGGINTLLAALNWSVKPENEGGFTNRIDDNIFRDVWLVPDVNRLLPPDADSPQYLPNDALLSRKDLVGAARELRKKWRQPGTFRPGLRLPMGVTITRVTPETLIASGVAVNNQRFYIPFEMRIQSDGSAKFFFDPNDYPSFNDAAMILMPWPMDSKPFFISDQQVEDALLTTSAFPIGFGRKRLQYCRQKAFFNDEDSEATPAMGTAGADESDLVCPDGYELAEAEFSDGGLFDNLPVGLARLLSESSRSHKKKPLPVKYIYLDPGRERYQSIVTEDKRACEGENPPEACREMTFNFASEAEVLGGAIGTARRYELYRELTSDNWRLNLSLLSLQMADVIDANATEVRCDSNLRYFDHQLACSDRLRYAGWLLGLTYGHRMTPINPPLSTQALLKERIATKCQQPSTAAEQDFASECIIDALQLRKQLASELIELAAQVIPEEENLQADIRRSALSIDSDRKLLIASRGGPITGLLMSDFGAFLDYKFREFDYYVGVYDAIVMIANNQCTQNFPLPEQEAQRLACRDQLSEQLYHLLGVADNPQSKYAFALMAQREFDKQGGLRFAYEPMPSEDRDIRIIFEGLNKPYLAAGESNEDLAGVLSTEREFFEHLKDEGFEPTVTPEGDKSLLTMIMDDPDYWSHEMVNRATNRLVYLEQQADAIYRAREPDPEKRDQADTGLMGATALVLRTTTYKYPRFTFAPSTAPESWFWRNIIPYEVAFDFSEGDSLLFWQPTWAFKHFNLGLRMGLGFTGGMFSSNADNSRENYGTLGLDVTKNENTLIFNGWGITPAVYHNWEDPVVVDQTTFGMDVHANLFKNRVRISLGARDVIDNAGDTLFLTIGIADIPGLVYWLSR